jgi:hypothetical protein
MLATTLSVTMPRTWRAEHLYLLGLYPNAQTRRVSATQNIRHTSIGPSARSLLMLYSPRPPSRLPYSPCHEFLDSRRVSRHHSFIAAHCAQRTHLAQSPLSLEKPPSLLPASDPLGTHQIQAGIAMASTIQGLQHALAPEGQSRGVPEGTGTLQIEVPVPADFASYVM